MIRVKEEVRRALKGKKLYKRESYNDILTRLMKRRSFRESTPMSRELKLRRALRRKGSSSKIMSGLKVVQDHKLIQRGLS